MRYVFPIGFESWPVSEKQKYLVQVNEKLRSYRTELEKAATDEKGMVNLQRLNSDLKQVAGRAADLKKDPGQELMSVRSIFRIKTRISIK